MFREPSAVPASCKAAFSDGPDPSGRESAPNAADTFDLTRDPLNHRGSTSVGSGSLLDAVKRGNDGISVARRLTKFKRQDIGDAPGDPDDLGIFRAETFLTRSLAGVGAIKPRLRDGRATTGQEAIMAHGGDATARTKRYSEIAVDERAKFAASLENLRLYQACPNVD